MEALSALLRLGADVNARRHEDGVTALMLAACAGNAECVQVLLEAGADRTLRDFERWVRGFRRGYKRQTALSYAQTWTRGAYLCGHRDSEAQRRGRAAAVILLRARSTTNRRPAPAYDALRDLDDGQERPWLDNWGDSEEYGHPTQAARCGW